ncbi:MAG: DUF1622 domain-containing protein [Chloroflexi bacterium]|nr:DUF1622 domain-containing protein [Chloroflexota bacterium]MBA3852093.1 DUF1622 domain-containing protein [Chloroflexota bacterium]MDQ3407705.1 DUF1622 domain-containing protein [Chloroflexota bacterium]
MDVRQAVDVLGLLIDLVGVAVMVAGIALATGLALRMVFADDREGAYLRFRRGVGRSILVGIEILVAGDIIRTVAIEPTFDSIIVLGGIVLIRTFLSFSLEVELTGSWPWRGSGRSPASVHSKED